MKKKVSLVAVLLFTSACASVTENNRRIVKACATEYDKQKIISCHESAIFTRLKNNLKIYTRQLSISDFPEQYKIRTEILVSKSGKIDSINFLSHSGVRHLNQAVKKAIYKSSPLPVPTEQYFSFGGFEKIKFNIFSSDVPPVFGDKIKIEQEYFEELVTTIRKPNT